VRFEVFMVAKVFWVVTLHNAVVSEISGAAQTSETVVSHNNNTWHHIPVNLDLKTNVC
jgi:hypothetical protein